MKPGVVPSIYGNEQPKKSEVFRSDRLQKRNNKKIVASLLLEAESLEETTEPEASNENNSFIDNCQESVLFSTNNKNILFLSDNPEGISFMECNEGKPQLEEQVKTLQKEV